MYEQNKDIYCKNIIDYNLSIIYNEFEWLSVKLVHIVIKHEIWCIDCNMCMHIRNEDTSTDAADGRHFELYKMAAISNSIYCQYAVMTI